MRNLASVRRVKEIKTIPGADNIEVAVVDGWEVVTKKGEFKAGDLGAYFEIDSFLPERPEFEFLRKSSFKVYNGQKGFRLKTVKLRKQLSQGLLLPLHTCGVSHTTEGMDLTEQLEVIKYDNEETAAPAPTPSLPKSFCARLWARLTYLFRKQTRGATFPSFIPKTDETRVQNLSGQFESFAQSYFVATEKVDGSSFTAFRRGKDFGVCSRNLRLEKDENNKWWKVALKYNLEGVLKEAGDYAVQGELIGPGVQGNKYKLEDYDLFVFNIYDIKAGKYLGPSAVEGFCHKYGLKKVPRVSMMGAFLFGEKFKDVAEVLAFAEGKSALCATQEREGLVFVILDGDQRARSFKAISNKWLLKEEA